MWTPADSKTPQSARTNTQPLTPTPAETPGTPARAASPTQNQHSFIGKSIVIKGEIEAADPVYIYGRVEGLINAPAHRVTVGKDGKVEADINAREVVIMGEVCGNLNGGDRVEIRTEGFLTGDLSAHRICIEDGAILNGKIDVLRPSPTQEALESEENTDEDRPALEAVAG